MSTSKELRNNIIADINTLDLNSRVAANQLIRIAEAVYKLSEIVDEEQYRAGLAAFELKGNK